MEILGDLIEIKNSCLGLGFFDGVHLGHKKLLTVLVENAKYNGVKSVVISFKNSPAEKFFNDVKYINLRKERERLISEVGVDYLIELDFNDDLVNISAEDYVKNVLTKYFSPKVIVSGFNHTFGKNKLGNNQFLRENQSKYGYEYIEIEPVRLNGDIVSSTYIRELLSIGNLKKANSMLSEPFTISGIVEKGNQIGRQINYPTANISYPKEKVVIPYGVYRVKVKYESDIYKGMLNFGIKPTIDNTNKKPVAEVHILDFDKDIYGEFIEISVLDKIRDEQRFNSLSELKEQIKKDLEKC